jgi:hypothetical protein
VQAKIADISVKFFCCEIDLERCFIRTAMSAEIAGIQIAWIAHKSCHPWSLYADGPCRNKGVPSLTEKLVNSQS